MTIRIHPSFQEAKVCGTCTAPVSVSSLSLLFSVGVSDREMLELRGSLDGAGETVAGPLVSRLRSSGNSLLAAKLALSPEPLLKGVGILLLLGVDMVVYQSASPLDCAPCTRLHMRRCR